MFLLSLHSRHIQKNVDTCTNMIKSTAIFFVMKHADFAITPLLIYLQVLLFSNM